MNIWFSPKVRRNGKYKGCSDWPGVGRYIRQGHGGTVRSSPAKNSKLLTLPSIGFLLTKAKRVEIRGHRFTRCCGIHTTRSLSYCRKLANEKLRTLSLATLPSIGFLLSKGEMVKIKGAPIGHGFGHSYHKVTVVPLEARERKTPNT